MKDFSKRESESVLFHQERRPYFKKVERVEGLHSPVSRIHIIFCPDLGFLISYLIYIYIYILLTESTSLWNSKYMRSIHYKLYAPCKSYFQLHLSIYL